MTPITGVEILVVRQNSNLPLALLSAAQASDAGWSATVTRAINGSSHCSRDDGD
jgi:hypothetical protein